MNGTRTRENVLLVVLILLLAGISYYHFFFSPLQTEMASVAEETVDTETETAAQTAKAVRLKAMQKELDALLASGSATQIADYDNEKAVLAQLGGILAAASNYSVTLSQPVTGSDGTVRRNVSISFTAPTFQTAKAVVQSLAQSKWRCLVENVSFAVGSTSSAADSSAAQTVLSSGAVSVDLTVTYFERVSSAG